MLKDSGEGSGLLASEAADAAALYMHGENQNCLKETEVVVGQPGTPPYFYYLHAAVLLRLNAKDYGTMLRDLDAANRGIPYCSFCYFTQSKVHREMGDEAAGIADLEALVGKAARSFRRAGTGWPL